MMSKNTERRKIVVVTKGGDQFEFMASGFWEYDGKIVIIRDEDGDIKEHAFVYDVLCVRFCDRGADESH